jgi:hypothetical protein
MRKSTSDRDATKKLQGNEPGGQGRKGSGESSKMQATTGEGISWATQNREQTKIQTTTGKTSGAQAGSSIQPVKAYEEDWWSVKRDSTGHLGWMYLSYLGLKPSTELYELVEFIIRNVADREKEMSESLQQALTENKLIFPSLFPGMLDTGTTRYAIDTTLDFDRIMRNNRRLQDKVSRKGGLRSLLIERKVERVL